MATETPRDTGVPMATVEDLEKLAERVDQAIGEVQSLEPDARKRAMQLKSAIEEFHKIGLTRIVKAMKEDPHGKQILFQLVDEPAVYTLFAMHGLVRADLTTRVHRVIEMVRPYMQSHGGDVKLVEVRDHTVVVQLQGNCNGCSMSSVTLKNTVEESLQEHVPEIERVEVIEPDTVGSLVQLNGESHPESRKGWMEGPLVSEIPADRPFAFDREGQQVVLISSAKGLRAYRNACAHQGLPLDGGELDVENGTLTCPWHGFQFDSESGECFTAPQCQLEPFPLRVENDRIWVRTGE